MMMQKHKIIALIIALPAALLLWMYVVTTVATEQTKTIANIPVAIDGTIVLEERGLMITDGGEASITLELDGDRVSLSKIDADNIRITVDVSRIYEAGEYSMNYSISYPDTVAGSQINIIRRSSQSIKMTVSNVLTKTVPITLDWSGTIEDGYLFDAENAEIDTTEVIITGPDYDVAQVEGAAVVYDVSKLKETVVENCGIELRNAAGELVEVSDLTTLNVQQVSVTLPILRYKDLTLTLDIVDGGGATAQNAEITFDPPSIRVTGTASVIDELEDTFCVGEVDLAKIIDQEKKEFKLTLPAGIKVFTGEKEVQATIKIIGLETKELTATDILLLNTQDGLKAELSTRSVTVTVRGSAEEIAQLTADMLHVRADLSDYAQTGAFTVPATVLIDGLESVGVIGSVNIGVTIK